MANHRWEICDISYANGIKQRIPILNKTDDFSYLFNTPLIQIQRTRKTSGFTFFFYLGTYACSMGHIFMSGRIKTHFKQGYPTSHVSFAS